MNQADKLLHEALAVLRYPDNGVHHCRSCRAGSSNQWQHDDYCIIRAQELRIESLRNQIRNYFQGVVHGKNT